MNTKRELKLIKDWFETIRNLATTKQTVNGFVMSDEFTFDEIAVKARDAIMYINILLEEL